MKKRNILLSLLLASAIILAACGSSPEETGEGTPGLTEAFGTPGVTESFGSPEATEPMGTPAMTESVGTPATTEAVSTPQTTSSVITPTVQTTLPVTGTEVIPPTGFIDPGRVSNLLDFGVWNQEDQQIGEVEDLVLNLGRSHVDYVIVNTAGYGDAAERHVPVPWEALMVVSAKAQQAAPAAGPQNGFVLSVDQSQFDNAPEIDLATVPKLGEQAEGWDADIHNYWQDIVSAPGNGTSAPATTGTPESTITQQTGLAGVVLATKLLDVNFQGEIGAAGAASMKVDDVLVDVESGEIQYVVLSASSTVTGEKIIPLPLKVLGWDATNNAFIPNVDPQALLQAPGFEAGKYPPTITPDWDANLRSYWKKYLSPGN